MHEVFFFSSIFRQRIWELKKKCSVRFLQFSIGEKMQKFAKNGKICKNFCIFNSIISRKNVKSGKKTYAKNGNIDQIVQNLNLIISKRNAETGKKY